MSVISKNKGTSLRSFVLNSGLRNFKNQLKKKKRKRKTAVGRICRKRRFYIKSGLKERVGDGN